MFTTNHKAGAQLRITTGPLKYWLSALAAVLLCVGTVSAQTILIGPNQYAFQYTNNNNYGLFFNAAGTQYEFRDGSALPVMAIDANTGMINTNMEFSSTSNLMVAPNRYAFRSAANPNYGVYFGTTDYEFRDSGANSTFSITANSGDVSADGTITSGGTMYAPGGNSSQWNAAYGWGNHASAGYLTSESDPQVGFISTNRVPRWSGSSLVNGSITDNLSSVSIDEPTTVNSGSSNNSTTAGNFKVGSTTSYHLGLDNNEVQAYNGTGHNTLFLNYWGGDINFGLSSMLFDRSTERFGINTTLPGTKLDVQGEGANTEGLIRAEVNHSSSSDTRAIAGHSIPAPGYGYGVYGQGGYRGVYGYGYGTSYTGTVTGVYGYASGTAGTRIGIYGYAGGGSTNWAGYFLGDINVTGTVFLALEGEEENVPDGYALAVGGKILGEELKIQLTQDWPDYVFDKEYALMPMDDLESFITDNNHLPGMPSAADIEADNGIEVGEMQRRTVEKLEELTLYILELKAENDKLGEQNKALNDRLETLENR